MPGSACPPHAAWGALGSPPSRPSSPGALHHRGWAGVNPDASLFPGGRGSDADARHGCDDPAGRPDSACPPPGAPPGEPPARRPARHNAGRDHTGCKSETAYHNGDNGPDGPAEVPWAPSAGHQRSTWTPPPPRRILSLQPCPARLGRGSGTEVTIGCRCRARSFGPPLLRLSLAPVSSALLPEGIPGPPSAHRTRPCAWPRRARGATPGRDPGPRPR